MYIFDSICFRDGVCELNVPSFEVKYVKQIFATSVIFVMNTDNDPVLDVMFLMPGSKVLSCCMVYQLNYPFVFHRMQGLGAT